MAPTAPRPLGRRRQGLGRHFWSAAARSCSTRSCPEARHFGAIDADADLAAAAHDARAAAATTDPDTKKPVRKYGHPHGAPTPVLPGVTLARSTVEYTANFTSQPRNHQPTEQACMVRTSRVARLRGHHALALALDPPSSRRATLDGPRPHVARGQDSPSRIEPTVAGVVAKSIA